MSRAHGTPGNPNIGLAVSDSALRAAVKMLLSVHGFSVHELGTSESDRSRLPSLQCLVTDETRTVVRNTLGAGVPDTLPLVVLAPWPDDLHEGAGAGRTRYVPEPFVGASLVRTVWEAAGVEPEPPRDTRLAS